MDFSRLIVKIDKVIKETSEKFSSEMSSFGYSHGKNMWYRTSLRSTCVIYFVPLGERS